MLAAGAVSARTDKEIRQKKWQQISNSSLCP